MGKPLTEARLPGIGTKYVLEPAGGGRLTLILHNDGRRELYHAVTTSSEPQAINLDDEEARQFGAALAGAWARPKIVSDLEVGLGELTIEWTPLPDSSPLIGLTLTECRFRGDLGVTVISILREPEPITAAMPHHVLQKGDTLVTVARARDYAAFHDRLEHGLPDS